MAVDDSYTKLLLHCNGTDGSTTITDEAGKTVTPNGNAQIDTAQSKFGGASLLLDGAGDYLSIPDSDDWQLDGGSNSNEWTIDFWVRFGSVSSNQYILSQAVDASNRWGLVYVSSTTQLRFFINSSGSSIVEINNSWSPSINTWYHVAVVKQGTTGYKFFVNGAQIGTTQTDTDVIPNFAAALQVGAYSTVYMTGWIDELRVSKGIARWTTNFAPPDREYPLPLFVPQVIWM
ncbi:MAG: LamG domain-containing protein [Anaerolineaceae bacterium]